MAAGLVASAASAQTWFSQGPAPTINAQVEGMSSQSNPVSGAVRAIAAHPTNASIVYAGSINGGIWKTTNATALNPTWTAQTDFAASLSTGALVFDPTDATSNTLLAGIGRYSSLSSTGGPRTGLLRTTNGGTLWTPLGLVDLVDRNIAAVSARGAVLMAAVSSTGAGSSGLYRSTNTGTSFTLVSGAGGTGLPSGACLDLAGDPGNVNRFYVGVTGTNVGVYRSDNGGATWVSVTAGITGLSTTTTGNMKLSVHNSAGNNVVYCLFVNSGRAAGVFRSTNQGASWTAMDLPLTNEVTAFVGLHPGGQGNTHLALTADSTNPNLVYAGGDRQPTSNNDTGGFPNSIGALNYTGRLFRGDASLPLGSQWTPLTHSGTSNNSSPHADSRSLVFAADGTLIEGDDGGIYKRSNPTSSAGSWTALLGNMAVTEFHSVEWDHVSRICVGGTQDTGTTEQATTNGISWRSVNQGDGGKVAVDDLNATFSYRYTSSQFLGGFRRRTMNASNGQTASTFPALALNGSPGLDIYDADSAQFYTPVESNIVSSGRLVILMTARTFESLDRGATVTDLGATGGTPTAAAYGGLLAGVANPDVLYVGGSTGTLALRTTSGGALSPLTGLPWGTATLRDIALDPTDWRTAVVITSTAVYITRNAGGSWTNITGAFVDTALRSCEVIPAGAHARFRIAIAGVSGVYATSLDSPGAWAELIPALPNAPVRDIHFDSFDRVFIAGLLGRGAWTVTLPDCVADMDNGTGTGTPDGGVGIEDLLYYLGVYDAGTSRADVDDGTGTGTPDGGVGIEDLLYYLERYDAGC
jgi:hypothetical protein